MRRVPATNKKYFIIAPAVIIVALLVVFFAPWTGAAGGTRIDIRMVDADGPGFTFADNVITITRNGNFVITGATNIRRIVVQSGLVDVNITLSDVDINLGTRRYAAFLVRSGAEVNLTLAGDNTFTSGGVGLGILGDATLVITRNSRGSLTTTSAYGPGIGALIQADTGGRGSIIIYGGTIMAAGGSYGDLHGWPGIGGGGNITIGGNADVTATGGNGRYGGAAGIGGATGGNSGNITITDAASVTAVGGDGLADRGGGFAHVPITNGGGAGVGSGGGFSQFSPGSSRWSKRGLFETVVINNTGRQDFRGGGGYFSGANVGTGGGFWRDASGRGFSSSGEQYALDGSGPVFPRPPSH